MRRKLLSVLSAVFALMLVLTSCFGPRGDESSSEAETESKKNAASYNALVTGEDLNRVKSVVMGGGGYVTGLIVHPDNPDKVYARTDVGGAYRWEADTESWTPITESMTSSSYFGCDGIAMDYNNPDIVYLCAGNGFPSDVFKSTDGGDTWTPTNLLKEFLGNGDKRTYGECIQVDPNNSNVIVCGTRYDGIYYSLDGSATWLKANIDIDKQSVRSLAIDRTSARGGRSMVMYAQVTEKGVYKSTDGGANWKLMENSPQNPCNIKIANNGVVYVTAGKEGVFRIVGNNFVSITPSLSVANDYNSFIALGVDPKNSNRIAVCTSTSKKDGTTSSMQLPILYSSDGGANWENVTTNYEKVDKVPWWPEYYFSSATATLAFTGTNSLWFTDWYGMWRTDNLNPGIKGYKEDGSPEYNKRQWKSFEKGHEEFACFGAITTPGTGIEVVVGQADNGSIWTSNINDFPIKGSRSAGGQWFDYYVKDPYYVVGAGSSDNSGKVGGVQISTDGGKTFYSVTGWDSSLVAHNVALCSESKSIMVAATVQNVAYVTFNKGRTWTKSEGLPAKTIPSYWTITQILAADKGRGNTFYYLTHKGFYVSEDWGLTWKCTNEDVKLSVSSYSGTVLTYEGRPGEIWVNTGGRGTFYSNDYGQTFSEIEGIDGYIALGKGKNDGDTILWYMGTIGTNKKAIYYSEDNGASFIKATDNTKDSLVKATSIYGDCNKYGRVFISTNGRGWQYLDVTENDEKKE